MCSFNMSLENYVVMPQSKDNVRMTQGSSKTFLFWIFRFFHALCSRGKKAAISNQESFSTTLYSRSTFFWRRLHYPECIDAYEVCWVVLGIHSVLKVPISAHFFVWHREFWHFWYIFMAISDNYWQFFAIFVDSCRFLLQFAFDPSWS